MKTRRERRVEEEMQRAEDLDLVASAHQVRELVNHPAWRDVRTFIEDHIEYCREGLETATDLPHLRFIQGQIKVCKTILGLPDQLIEWDEIEQDKRSD